MKVFFFQFFKNKNIFLLVYFVLCVSCGGKSILEKKTIRVGVDPRWMPKNFEEAQPYVNGYLKELFFEISKVSPLAFDWIEVNWDVLLEGLQTQEKLKESRYDAALSSMKPYVFNTALYDFSKILLNTGTVLIVPVSSPVRQLKDLKNKKIGALEQTVLEQEQEGILVQFYENIPALLEDLLAGQIEGALLPVVPALNYVKNLYAMQFRMTLPLTEEGIRLIVNKGTQQEFLKEFEKGMALLEKEKKLEALKKKWGFDVTEFLAKPQKS